MNIKQLEHLLALSDSGSFSRAAEALFITQSALSRSIKSLEDEIGALLIDRIGKRNELTPLGLDVAARARRIVSEMSELQRSALLLGQGGRGSISVGLGSGPGALLMTPLMCAVAALHPEVRLSVTRGPTELQILQLRSRELDALVVDMRRVVPAADLNIESLGELKAGFIASASHPLARRKSVSIADILKFPVASIPLSDEVVRLMVDQYGLQANPAGMVRLQCEEIASLIDTVAQSNAIYLGIVAAARTGLQNATLVELPLKPTFTAKARFAYVTLAGRTEAPVMSFLRQFVHDHLHD